MPPALEAISQVAITQPGQIVKPTNACTASCRPTPNHIERWQGFIDQLFSWWNDPGYFADEDFEIPSSSTIERAMNFAQTCREAGIAAPDRVVPAADGGVVFEIQRGKLAELACVREVYGPFPTKHG